MLIDQIKKEIDDLNESWNLINESKLFISFDTYSSFQKVFPMSCYIFPIIKSLSATEFIPAIVPVPAG